jgi:preprotein translocase subunit SecE
MPVEERDKAMTKTTALPVNPEPGVHKESAIARGRTFLTEVRSEMRKVTTPTWPEVRSTTTVVIIAVFAFAAFFYVTDTVLHYVVQAFYHWLGLA